MGAHQSQCSADDGSSPIRKISGNCNTQTVYITLCASSRTVPIEPPICISGNCNNIKIYLTEIYCQYGDGCLEKEPADKPVRVSGNCNNYKFEITCYGRAPKELVRVSGNANDVKVKERKEQECRCAGPPPTVANLGGFVESSQLQPGNMRSQAHEQPPAYEPSPDYRLSPTSPRPTQTHHAPDEWRELESHRVPDDSKMLLVSSISSLEAFDQRTREDPKYEHNSLS
ncbi:hypothetical protein M433DRAFT_156994 [Acidomyces richmondensis BFW]|nr:MAG: hypothetical protein FE78DRAFT_94002 [Acidomyces sp. 'richmondensis']KYG43249.1 hypothetical protein M433DRAFT_156994 [Acidomyces richmondensis BFW]